MKGIQIPGQIVALLVAYLAYYLFSGVTTYQLKTAAAGVNGLLNLPQDDIDSCIAAYQFFQNGTRDRTDQEAETEHVRAYYAVLNQIMAIADIEKMYIPPHIIPKEGLYQNQLDWERMVFQTLKVSGKESHILDIGCGRGRISHYFAKLGGGRVSGFNIDEYQIQNAIEYAEKEGMSNQLSFQQGDHHKKFNFPDNHFDGSYSFQAVWPFFKPNELDSVAREIFRVLKPGARYSCSEYLLNPAFDWKDPEHVELHRLFLPTLAATQSNYPKDVTDALERAGFKIIRSAPSIAPAWPLTDQKTDLFIFMRQIIIGLTTIGISPAWVQTLVDNLLLGGRAWADAEKMKIADLNWQITVEKPLK